jgi:hypothetical protein
VSQALVAGGVEMNDDWYFKYVYRYHLGNEIALGPSEPLASNPTYVVSDWTATWGAVSAQYEYFSNPKNGYSNSIVDIKSAIDVSNAARSGSVQLGDLVYWFKSEESLPHHAAIVSDIAENEIYYAAHTNDWARKELSMKIGDERVQIVHINDLIPKGGGIK